MKRKISLVVLILCFIKLYAYEFIVSVDSYLYGNNYPLNIADSICKISKNSVISFDTVQIATFDIEGEKKFINADYSYYIYVTTQDGKKGYISLFNISNTKSLSNYQELKKYIWGPEYELEVLKTKNKDKIVDFNSFYANYNEWRKYTDWQNEKWYDVYYPPILVITDSIIYFSDTELFNGFVFGKINNINTTTSKIDWTCIESKHNDYSYKEVKSNFVNFFKKGKNYIFSYSLDGDYLTIHSNNSFSYSFIKFAKETNYEIANLIYPINSKTFNENNITWPRHADGSCDYE